MKLFFNTKVHWTIATLDLSLRLYVAYIMISNAPVGSFIPLSSLGLDQESYAFLMQLWDMGGLMIAAKGFELIGGALLIFHRTSLLGIFFLSPVVFSIINISLGLWNNFSSTHFLMLMTFAISIYLERKKLQSLFYTLTRN